MKKYFAVIENDDRWGPFDSFQEPLAILNQASRDRGHTDTESEHFFLNQAMVEVVDDQMLDQA